MVEPGDMGVGTELGVMLQGVRSGHRVGLSKLESPISPQVYVECSTPCPGGLKWGFLLLIPPKDLVFFLFSCHPVCTQET